MNYEKKHPRLFMTRDKIEEMKQLILQPGHHLEAFC